jgi:hypothetical protein
LRAALGALAVQSDGNVVATGDAFDAKGASGFVANFNGMKFTRR